MSVTWLPRDWASGVRPLPGRGIYPFTTTSRLLWGTSHFRWWKDRSVKLISRLNSVPRLRTCVASCPFPHQSLWLQDLHSKYCKSHVTECGPEAHEPETGPYTYFSSDVDTYLSSTVLNSTLRIKKWGEDSNRDNKYEEWKLSKVRPPDINVEKVDLLIAELLRSIQQTNYASNSSNCSSSSSTRPQISGLNEHIRMKQKLALRACGFDILPTFNKTVLFNILSVKDYLCYNICQHFIDCFRLDTATKINFCLGNKDCRNDGV